MFLLRPIFEKRHSNIKYLIMQLAQLTEMEVKHRCHQVLELGFPLGGIAKLFAQDWEGDVTVVMPATLAQVCPKRTNISLFRSKKHVLFQLVLSRNFVIAEQNKK